MAKLQIFWKEHRKHLKVPELNSYPASPSPSDFFHPGDGLQASFRTSFKQKLQRLPELNQYTATLVANPELSAWKLQTNGWRSYTNRRLKTAEILSDYETVRHYSLIIKENIRKPRPKKLQALLTTPVYPATPAGYYNGYYPGSGAQKALKVTRKQRNQTLPELNNYPLAVTAAAVTAYTPVASNRIKLDVRLQRLVITDVYPITTEATSSWAVRFNKTSRTQYKLLKVLEVNLYPSTPAIVTEPVPSWIINTFRQSSRRHKTQYIQDINIFPETVVVATGITAGINSLMRATQGIDSGMNATQGASSEMNTTRGIDSLI